MGKPAKEGQGKEQGKESKKSSELEELENTLKRVQAEFENYKKRVFKEQENFIKYCSAKVLEEMLQVLDGFESALEKASGKEKEAIKPLYEHLKRVLEKHGIKSFESAGTKFDSEKHEIVGDKSDKEKEDGIVLEEVLKGYLLHDKVLRHAKVKVNNIEKGEEKEGEKQKEGE